jgi:ATP-dependent helicase/nuclease subunit A
VVDLATGAGLDEAVAAQAAAEGVIGHEPRIRTLARAALKAPSVVEAAALPHWREVHVAVPIGPDALAEQPQVLEGYVDLLYRRVTGLVVVDYKTGPSGPDDDLDGLVDRYRLQGASYALAVSEATGGEPVVDVVFVFLTPKGAIERPLPHLDAAIAHTRDQIRRGTFVVAG